MHLREELQGSAEIKEKEKHAGKARGVPKPRHHQHRVCCILAGVKNTGQPVSVKLLDIPEFLILLQSLVDRDSHCEGSGILETLGIPVSRGS